jgi:lysophospholipid acyltransferase (LPLAT)-like uncharacterized protein
MARLHHHPAIAGPLTALLAGYIRLVRRSGRWAVLCPEATAQLIRSRRPCIGVFWHGRMMMAHVAWQAVIEATGCEDPLRPCIIGSDHADARFVARVTRQFGIASEHASNKRGGIGLVRAALTVLRRDQIAVMTPDGPRGPAMRAKAGVVRIAMRAGVPVVPLTFAAARAKVVPSWDSFVIPYPFTRGVFAIGSPILLPADGDPEAGRLEVERALTALTEEADAMLREPVAAPAT